MHASRKDDVRAVVFDLGGVVFRHPDPPDVFASAAQRLGIPMDVARTALFHSEDVVAANTGRLTAEEYAERAAQRLGVTAPDVLRFLEDAFAGVLDTEVAAELRRQRSSRKVAALTNNWSFLTRLLARHQLANAFDVVVNSADVGVCKPDLAIYRVLLERLGCAAGQTVFLDDDSRNVDAASAVGMRAIHFVDKVDALRQLRMLCGRPHDQSGAVTPER